ncbi:MAG: hypothetical protein LBQ12_10220 [Deltaproteobacteria bacterium]|jgi:hypothetical protein|nr:hypothetical protein [Deltaproteobacteria bacterium]
MKAPLAKAFLVFLAASLPAGPQCASAGGLAAEWLKIYGGESQDSLEAVAAAGGGIVAAGTSFSGGWDVESNKGGYDVWILKLARGGEVEFKRSIGGSGFDFKPSVAQASDGGFLVAGMTGSSDGDFQGLSLGNSDAFLARLGRDGKTMWVKTYGGEDFDAADAVLERPEGGYLLVGRSSSRAAGKGCGESGFPSPWAAALDRDGGLSGSSCLGPGFAADFLSAAAAPGSDPVFVAGDTEGGNPLRYVAGSVGYDASFGKVREITSESGGGRIRAVAAVRGGGLAAGGFRRGPRKNSRCASALFAGFGPGMEAQWENSFEKATSTFFTGMARVKGGFVGVGSSLPDCSSTPAQNRALAVFADAEGNALSHLVLRGGGPHLANSAAVLEDGAVAVVGDVGATDGDFSARRSTGHYSNNDAVDGFVMVLKPESAPQGLGRAPE